MLNPRFAALTAAWLILSIAIPASAQSPIADYQLQDTLNSSVGTIGPLTIVGDASDVSFTDNATVDGHTQSVLNISVGSVTNDIGGGVQSQTKGFLASPANYSVVLLADFTISASDPVATKVFDFKNLSTDDGLYINGTTGELDFNQVSNQPGGIPLLTTGVAPPITTGTYTQIVLTRDSSTNLVSVYENGALDFSFTDTDGLAVLGDTPTATTPNADLTVFKDDGTGLGSTITQESSVGDIARLRLYDGALTPQQVAALDTVAIPEPASLSLMFLFVVASSRLRLRGSDCAPTSI